MNVTRAACRIGIHKWDYSYHLVAGKPGVPARGKADCVYCAKHEEFDLLDADLDEILGLDTTVK